MTRLFLLSRGGGYECDEYSHVILHCQTLCMCSLLIRSVLFHRKDTRRGYVAIATSLRVLMRTLALVPPGVHMYAR
jgi:hypothetical protein